MTFRRLYRLSALTILLGTAVGQDQVVRDVRLPGTDEKIFCAVYQPKPHPEGQAGLIIHLYGSGGSHTDFNVGRPPYENFRKFVAERGYWLVVPELGPKHWMNESACQRVDAVIKQWINRENVDPERVHLIGTSMGGGSSLLYVMRRPGKVRSVIAVFPMTDFTRWLQEQPGYRQRVEDAHQISDSNRAEMLETISPLVHLEAFRRTPVLLLHGAKDPVVKAEHSRDFAAGLRSKGYSVVYREAADEIHRDEIAGPFQQELADFLTKPLPITGKTSDWHGFTRHDFEVEGKSVLVVAPDEPAPGRPWVWNGEFFGHKPEPDIALLQRGFHIVYMQVPDLLGCPKAVAHWNDFYDVLTRNHGLAKKAALVGLSRGGLYCYNWAAANPDKVACIYGDAPVCDFKSWPGGKGKGQGSSRDWDLVFQVYGFQNEAEALAYDKNPVDNLSALAKHKVPLLHVYGDADEVVPWDENTGLLAERYRALGGDITLIAKKGVGHHPHGLDDPTPIVKFIVQHSLP